MKIIHQKIIHRAEIAFIDAIRDHLNWDAVKSAVKQHFDVDVHENVKYISGSLGICQNEPAIRFDFDLEIKFSIFINRDGELIRVSAAEGQDLIMEDNPEPSADTYLSEMSSIESNQTASELSQMIKKING